MISIQAIGGATLRDMIMAGAALLEKNREAVDALNVFPVPDGDTGTNMSLTLLTATREMNAKTSPRACVTAEAFAKGALRGARGNSGVITSQLYRGFARALEGVDEITPTQFAKALKAGADTAYKAIMKPKEGTILTVARVIAEDAIRQAAKAPDDFDALFDVILKSGDAILRRTQDMLPALKSAGVVDAGGRGLLLIYSGYAAALRGESIEMAQVDMSSDGQVAFEDDHDSLEEITFTYCTEFLIQSIGQDKTDSDVSRFRMELSRIGDCVLVVGDLQLLKVHVHTNNPGKALQLGMELGELINLKIENMAEQRREKLRKAAEQPAEAPHEYGMVAVSLGDGFSKIFSDLNVDQIVDGGQTMNPSSDQLARAIAHVNAKTVFVLPNNGNVILAAQQAAEMSDRNVRVIPTKNVAMGIASVVAFQADLDADENVRRMDEAAQRVKTGMITFAVRDSDLENMHISEGDFIGLHNGKVEYRGETVDEVLTPMMDAIVEDDDGLITVYYGADTPQEDAERIGETLSSRHPDCDVEVHRGGQPLYYYLIAVE